MTQDLMLVGSIAYDSAEETFRAIGPRLGRWLPFIPDGEIGQRQFWITALSYRVFHGHPDIETVARPMTKDGVEAWNRFQADLDADWQFRVRPGVAKVRFGDPGWRLGYASDAIQSYSIFKAMRKEGILPADMRFQVCLPLTYSGVGRTFVDPEDYAKVYPGLTEALHHEVRTLFEHIPHKDLVIQWDCAIEDNAIERALKEEGGITPKVEALANNLFAPAHDVSAHIPRDVLLGFHACYGTAEGWPVREPQDLTGVVLLCNAAVAAAGRPVDFLHMPTVASKGNAYCEPLAKLESDGARVYMGLIHALHDRDGMRRQMEQIKKHLPDFGIAAPCGFGRGPGKMSAQSGLATPNAYMEGMIAAHEEAVSLLHDVL